MRFSLKKAVAMAALLGALGGAWGETEVHPSLDEIEVMIHQKRYHEALLRLPAVDTSQKSPRWDSLVDKAAQGYIKIAGGNQDEIGTDLLRQFPSLKRSSSFLAMRQEMGLTALARCYTLFEKKACTARAIEFQQNTSLKPATIMELGMLVSGQHGPLEAWPLFKEALDPMACADTHVQRSLFEALAQDKGPEREAAIKAATGVCWEKIHGRADREIVDSTKPQLVEGLCEILKQKKALRAPAQKRCGS